MSTLEDLHFKAVSIILLAISADGSDKLLEESATAGDLTCTMTSPETVEGELEEQNSRGHGNERRVDIH